MSTEGYVRAALLSSLQLKNQLSTKLTKQKTATTKFPNAGLLCQKYFAHARIDMLSQVKVVRNAHVPARDTGVLQYELRQWNSSFQG